MKKNRRSIISTGAASLVLIFSLLCMLAFAVLSLVSARANLRMSQKSAHRTTAYYEAENQANDILLEISDVIDQNLTSKNEETFYQNIHTALEGKYGIVFPSPDRLEYQIEMEEQQFLFVSLSLSFQPLKNETHYEIISWNTGSDYEWNPDTSLPLLSEDSFKEDRVTE